MIALNSAVGASTNKKTSPEFTLCTGGKTQTELGMRRNTFETQGRNEETNEKTTVGLAGADVSHFHLSVSLPSYSLIEALQVFSACCELAAQSFSSLNSDQLCLCNVYMNTY